MRRTAKALLLLSCSASPALAQSAKPSTNPSVSVALAAAQGATTPAGQPAADPAGATADAAAPTGDTPPAGYSAAIDRGIKEFDLGNYAEARSAFRQAHNLYPNARTLRGLGKAEFELKNYRASVEFLEAALSSPVRPLSADLRQDVEALLARARSYVAHYDLQLTPPAAQVLLDGEQLRLAPGDKLVLEVGDHLLEVRAGGYQPHRRTLRVTGGTQQVLRIQLQQTSGQTSPTDSESVWEQWWLWTVLGVGVAAIATGVVIGLNAEDTIAAPRDGNVEAWGTVTALTRLP